MINILLICQILRDTNSSVAKVKQQKKIEPGFIFPFYGHLVHTFYATTHGFLSFAPRIHNLMYKTQYIAPLRVKLDPGRHNESSVNFKVHGNYDNTFTIEWTNVTVAQPFEHPMGGKFTFQLTLQATGDIIFVYKFVPDLLTTDALYDNEPVAGLSDAFLIGDSELHVYHTLNVENSDIRTGTVVYFKAKPTCIRQTSCDDCANLRQTSEFGCTWCPDVHRCSDGADRLREHWDTNECGIKNVSTTEQCANIKDSDHTEWRSSMIGENSAESIEKNNTASTVVSAVVSSVLVLILVIMATVFIYIYGRRNPGGWAEKIASMLETPYKRFGILDENENNNDQVEMGRKTLENNNNNNNSSSNDGNLTTTVAF